MTSEWIDRQVATRALPVSDDAIDRIITGDSVSIRQLKRMIAAVAVSDAAVVVTGPTGSGKELVAEALHRASGRSGPLVAVNCAAIPADLLESELFGHEKGAFTGADRARTGRIEQAAGGTLFLDEIGDMPLALQAKLLRVLESRRIQRLGSNSDIPVDFRLVTATHRDLSQSIEQGRFRADLFYRINVFTLTVPSLAERTCDIPLILARMISDQMCQNPAADAPHFDVSAIRALAAHSWPGNVRELKNVLNRAFVMLPGRMVTARHVRDNLLGMAMPDLVDQGHDLPDPARLSGDMPDPAGIQTALCKLSDIDMRGYIRDIEVAMIEAALDKRSGNVAQAADMLRLRRTTLIEKMKKYGIRRGLDA